MSWRWRNLLFEQFIPSEHYFIKTFEKITCSVCASFLVKIAFVMRLVRTLDTLPCNLPHFTLPVGSSWQQWWLIMECETVYSQQCSWLLFGQPVWSSCGMAASTVNVVPMHEADSWSVGILRDPFTEQNRAFLTGSHPSRIGHSRRGIDKDRVHREPNSFLEIWRNVFGICTLFYWKGQARSNAFPKDLIERV